jgi:predicted helicase
MKEGDSSALTAYLSEVRKLHRAGNATEHSYRGHLQNLFKALCPGLTLVNEPARIECGAPDLALLRRDLVVGYIEAKDLGKDLAREEKSAQMGRYLPALDNLILTDYLEFRFYRSGKPVATVRLADLHGDRITARTGDHETFLRLLADFAEWRGVQIRSASVLAERMAKKARLMRDIFRQVLAKDPSRENPLQEQFAAFKQVLLHDLDEDTFADIYAQTLAYGMFAARLHDPTLDDFSRQEAAALVPKSNPFLRNLFVVIAAADLDDRVAWVVDDLVDIFRTVNLRDILADFGKATAQEDPFLHFYETFLAAYDPALRKGCGVYYTPAPVVRFIVRAVDHLLKTAFGLPRGLADTAQISKAVPAEGDAAKSGKDKLVERSFHKVQILDPATGTGTFLAEVVRHIRQSFDGQEGLWPAYVENDLVPRLNGFEILMASYAICHLKLELLLRQTGYDAQHLSRRFNVFLANSLEDADPATGTLFASWLSREAREANRVKRDSPVMVVIGNPPYAVSSSNKSDWIQTLIADYKKNLNEKKLNLDDDYIKFIRMGQHYVEKNGQGVLAYISNNSFIDGITHRQMRRSLMEAFDDIYILDLHGSAKKKETCPDGSKDENVFDIMTGVSINLFVKTGKKAAGQLASVHHHELFGRREQKYETLEAIAFPSVPWTNLDPVEPNLFFVPKDFSSASEYEFGFSIKKLFSASGPGVKTERDAICIHMTSAEAQKTVEDFRTLAEDEIRSQYNLGKDSRDWGVARAQADVKSNYDYRRFLRQIIYRPFDSRFIYYTGKSKGFVGTPGYQIMKHLADGRNIGVIVPRQTKEEVGVFLTKYIVSHKACSAYDINIIFPLYLYSGDGSRTPNLDSALVAKIASGLGLKFVPEATGEDRTFAPLDLLDYIYAVLHTPSYREKYKEFLKIDFPRVPFPADAAQFRKLAAVGAELRALHLMESPRLDNPPYTFPVAGDNIVLKPAFKDGHVWINKTQYVGNVPKEVWEFYIGGYQPAQKWLKDRKGRALSYDDIRHYQKILAALAETRRLMAALP